MRGGCAGAPDNFSKLGQSGILAQNFQVCGNLRRRVFFVPQDSERKKNFCQVAKLSLPHGWCKRDASSRLGTSTAHPVPESGLPLYSRSFILIACPKTTYRN